jgi:hypothetical protein
MALSVTLAPSPGRAAPNAVAAHDDKLCAGCSAEAIWAAFLEHLKAAGKADLIPPSALPVDEDEENGEPGRDGVDLLSGDPVKGILFQLSPDLVNLDALFSTWAAEARPPAGEELEKARALAGKLRDSKDPYLAAYGVHFGSRLDVAAGDCQKAVAALEGLVRSCHFLPRREARKTLAQAYTCTGDDTLALLEYRLFQVDLPAEDETERAWADGEIKKIREKEHAGPLHHSEASMKEIAVDIGQLEVGQPTQAKAKRVEDVLEKVAKLLEQQGGG